MVTEVIRASLSKPHSDDLAMDEFAMEYVYIVALAMRFEVVRLHAGEGNGI